MDNKARLASTLSAIEEEQINSIFVNSPTGFCNPKIKRDDFDKDFVFGASTSAYQYEGGAQQGGRGISIWDNFSLTDPGKIEDGSNGNFTCYQYKMFKEDIMLLKRTGLKAYRFSISWPRILPGGKLSSGINAEGIKYYNDLIDALLAEGIEPIITLFHWDLPLTLEHDYGGFLSMKIVKDFRDYAELCFWKFGDRVKKWVTINEAWTYTVKGYVNASFPPGRGSPNPPPVKPPLIGYKASWRMFSSLLGNPSTEAYIVAHNFILAHAAVVALYRNQFQASQGGVIGMVNNINWYEPLNVNSEEDKRAATRAVDFMFGWFVSPLVSGDYPQSMRESVGYRLPEFTPEQIKLVKGSYDFLGVNYYTAYYAYNDPNPTPGEQPYYADQHLQTTPFRNGVPIGPQAGSSWLYIVPVGIYDFLKFAKKEYKNPLIYITENGVDEKNNCHHTLEQAQNDPVRVKYFEDHLFYVHKAIKEGCNVKAYLMWSLFDNYEWSEGYTVRFGIFYINFLNGDLSRYPKKSAIWWTNFLGDTLKKGSLKRLLTRENIEEENDTLKKQKT